MQKVSFIIPVYRNAQSIESVYTGLKHVLAEDKSLISEFVFVNDGSDDESLDILFSIQKNDENVVIINLSRNFGQIAAIISGLEEATGDLVVIQSADLQEPPDTIKGMIEGWRTGNKIIIAIRKERKDPLLNKVGSNIFYRMIRISGLPIPKGGFDFIAMDRQVVNSLEQMGGKNRFLQGDILWLGFKIQFIPYTRQIRASGKSQWNTRKKVKYLIDGILTTSYWPIRWMSLFGFFTATSSFIYALVIIYTYFFYQTPFKGWAPIMIVMLFIGGVIMMMLGLIGEYLWRIYDEVRPRPDYIVESVLRKSPEGNSKCDAS
jgi:dolichol-phosphate mannosyltransferase